MFKQPTVKYPRGINERTEMCCVKERFKKQDVYLSKLIISKSSHEVRTFECASREVITLRIRVSTLSCTPLIR